MSYLLLILLIGGVVVYLMLESGKEKATHQQAIKSLNMESSNDPRVLLELGDHQRALKNYPAAFSKYSAAEKLGSLTAKARLGVMYRLGEYVTKDLAKAEELFKDAAGAGDVESQRLLGMLYTTGWGDLKDATYWLGKASLNGDHAAPWILGGLYEQGELIHKSIGVACAWYEVAAKHPINSEYVQRVVQLKERFSKEDDLMYQATMANIKSFVQL